MHIPLFSAMKDNSLPDKILRHVHTECIPRYVKLNTSHVMGLDLERLENKMGKGDKACNQIYLLFPQSVEF